MTELRPADLVAAVLAAAGRWPDKIAWRFDPGETLTFADIDRRTATYAAALRNWGIDAGDRVAVMLRNRAQFPLSWLALARIGAAIVPLNVKYQLSDAAHVFALSGPAAIITDEEFVPMLSQLPACPPVIVTADLDAYHDGLAEFRVNPSATVNVQLTSGTTGYPKGCLLSHHYWLTLAGSLIDGFPRLRADDIMLTAQPFSYLDPQWNVVAALLAGAELVILDGFHPSTFWQSVRAHRVSYFYCLAAMPTLLLRTTPDPADRRHRVRAVQCSAIPPAQHAQLEDRWGVCWYEAFGMTESGADIRVTDADHDELVGTGCLGRPAANREARTANDGELLLRGPGMMDGYLGDPAATARAFRDGWFHTGDLARIDEQGRVFLLGRSKDMIRRGGENIAAREVEETLLAHPAVRLVAVIGVPDEIRGEEAHAFVVADGVAAPDLARFCAERLAAFKVPRFWSFHDDLPRTPSERVQKARLASLAGIPYDLAKNEWSR